MNTVRHRVWAQARVNRGVCQKCGERPIVRNRRHCVECLRRAADTMRQRQYGLSPQNLAEKLEAQNGKCLICGVRLRLTGRADDSVHVDHNHQTGQFRGLLCKLCNLGLGYFHDNREFLAQAIEYLA